MTLLPTPTTTQRGTDANLDTREGARANLYNAVKLLPTPSVADAMGGHASRSGDRSGELLLPGVVRLLPTPRVKNNENRQSEGYGGEDGNFYGLIQNPDRFGQYAPAIARWETVTGLTAPPPTEPTGRNGAHRLSARFVEFMMGQPAGWITDVPGITRNEALKACGNGVVSQQAFAAIGDCLRADQAVAS